MGRSLEGTRLKLPRVISQCGTQDMLDSPTTCVKCFLPREALLSPVVQSFYQRQFIGTYFNTYKNFRLPEGKAGTHHKPHCLCTQLRHPYQSGNGGSHFKSQVTRCQPRANFASRPFYGQQSQACYVNCFLHEQYLQNLKEGFIRGFIKNRLRRPSLCFGCSLGICVSLLICVLQPHPKKFLPSKGKH